MDKHWNQVLDITIPGIDLLFRDNCLLKTFYWENEEASEKETVEKMLDAARVLSQLFWSKSWFVDIAPTLYPGIIDVHRRQSKVYNNEQSAAFKAICHDIKTILESVEKDSKAWTISLLQACGRGLSRIALPSGVDERGEWVGVDCDGIKRGCNVYKTTAIKEQTTVWAQIENSCLGNEITIKMEMTGEVYINVILGNILFQPSLDPRPKDYMIRSRSLWEWQQANAEMYKAVIGVLMSMGWIEKNK